MNKLNIFSFFSGSGFLDLGFELNGYSIELVNEFSSSFINAYKYSRKQMGLKVPKYGYSNIDINEYLEKRSEELLHYITDARQGDNLVGFIGGPPCPDFSVAGKQRGRYGYYMTDRLTNAIEFGAPQNRDRILLFGVNKKLFPNCTENPLVDFPWKKYIKYSLKDLKQIKWPTTAEFNENSIMECPTDIPRELTVQYWFEKNDVENHPNGKECFVPRSGITKMLSVAEGDDSKKSYKRLHRWRYSPTVAYGNNEVHLHPYKARRLTVAEALALQSLPKNFSLPPKMSLTDKFKTIGNGVPFMLSSGIAKTIYDFMIGVLE